MNRLSQNAILQSRKWRFASLNLPRLLVVFILGFSSGLPLSLVTGTLQAWFASSGMSVTITAWLSLISFPYVARTLWAPLLDRYRLFSMGKRKSWILSMQILMFAGFNILAILKPSTHTLSMAIIATLAAAASATQDAAIDAHRTEYIQQSEHGMAAFVATFGYRIAYMLSGGLALVLVPAIGWTLTYQIMAAFLIPAMVAVILSEEPYHKSMGTLTFKQSFIEPFLNLFKMQRVLSILAFIFLFKLGEAFTASTSGIVMAFFISWLKFPVDVVGYVNKIFGVLAIITGGFIAGFAMLYVSLFRLLLVFGVLQAITNIFFVVLAFYGSKIELLILAVISDNFAAGLGTTAIVAFMMRVVNQQYTATQFSLLVAFASLPRILSGPIADGLRLQFGWVGMYTLSVVLALLFIPFLYRLRGYSV